VLGRVCGSDGSHASCATLTARLKLRAPFIHNVTSSPTHLHQTSSGLFVTFPSAPPLWSECCFFIIPLFPLLYLFPCFSLLFASLQNFIFAFVSTFLQFSFLQNLNFFYMFSVFHLYVLYRSVCLFYLRACILHSSTYGLQDRIPHPPPSPLQGRIFLLVAALKPD